MDAMTADMDSFMESFSNVTYFYEFHTMNSLRVPSVKYDEMVSCSLTLCLLCGEQDLLSSVECRRMSGVRRAM